MAKVPVVVVGSGVIGLTTALTLQRTQRYSVTVIGRNTPDDLTESSGYISQDWASPFAGANWRPYALINNPIQRAAEEESYFLLREIAREFPGTSGVRIAPILDFGTSKFEIPADLLHLSYVKNLKIIDPNTAVLPENASFGYIYDSLVINVLEYLPWLAREFCKLGGVIKAAEIRHIRDALMFVNSPYSVIVNCAAMGSYTLVNDREMYPTRGQTLLADAPDINFTMLAPGNTPEKAVYVIPRGDGTAILGGVFEANSTTREEDLPTTEEILRNCLSLCPQLLGGIFGSPPKFKRKVTAEDVEKLRQKVRRVNVGFRPSRTNGPRLEIEYIDSIPILHNYGHSSFGYQSSWGYANAAVRMLDASLSNKPKL
ncbi:hypothetical protein GGI25_000582 [Coemansia spiralis]|uniref:FAD dependent oxidoreductase domain-containing protein n=2 Tax=Coemansia TaxID=4863 RepID=A0A9W8G7B1_9FUNG|nr:hypothetical protein BX070DRAFT_228484 [Coemansia spiralis]KAJ1996043.1 hypothetical protein EDC05_000411 [Coemansia umbellata]KAJ2625484.1 hypothetical protein GGI26_000624 [Coemansia sp. RSA 1358]KAJ2680609.1 hypothetical protein GGI25_000582 [Coemansia spiralis]